MYFLKVAGLGFVHKNWQDTEPRFSHSAAKAKNWKTLEGALEFGNQKLTPHLKIGWEVWQEGDGEWIPLIRPQSVR